MKNKKQRLLSIPLFIGIISIIPITVSAEGNQEIKIVNYSESLMKLSKEYLSGDYAKVAEIAKKLLRIDPANESVKEMYVLANFKLKKYKTVVDFYSESETSKITSPVQLKMRAIAQVRSGNYIQAMSAWKSLRSVGPISAEWKAFYHYIAYKLNSESAFSELRKMNKVQPSIANDLIIGKLSYLDSKYDNAIVALNAALLKDKKNAEAMELLGDIYIINHDYDGALGVYTQTIVFQPDNQIVKMKVAKILVKQGRYMDALKTLNKDNNPQVAALREKISTLANSFLNNDQSRTIAEEKVEVTSITESDGKLVLEEKMIPKDIDVYADAAPVFTDKGKPALAEIKNEVVVEVVAENVETSDISTLELGFSPKSKKYNLSGTGFNANVNYSSGGAINFLYIFSPRPRKWNAQFELEHSRVELKKLNGLTPNKVTFSETNAVVGLNYFLVGNLSVGPSLMYEKMTSNITSPSVIRGNVDFFNTGIVTKYSIQARNNFKINLEASYYRNVLANAKTTALGIVDTHAVMNGSLKFYYEMRPMAFVFIGASFSNTTTQYESSSARGTLAAKEIEKDLAFPLGINYAF